MKIINCNSLYKRAVILGVVSVLGMYLTGCKADVHTLQTHSIDSEQMVREDAFSARQLVQAARAQIGVTVAYDPAYTVLAYPNGDVSQDKGVCTDVVIRAMRVQGIDLQKLVHEDMVHSFAQYPKRWGLSKPDASIDHRRVLNLEVFMQRKGRDVPITRNPNDFHTGDWVTWRVGEEKLPHIGIVSDRRNDDGVPLVIHNIGQGTQEEDALFAFPMAGHYRW